MSDETEAELRAEIERLREELRAAKVSEGHARRLAELSTDTMMLHDAHGRVIDFNAHACKNLGYTREELRGLNVRDFEATLAKMPPETWGQNWARMEPGVPVTTRGIHRRKDGTTFPVEVRLGIVVEAGDKLMLATATDITEREGAERALRESVERFRYVFEGAPMGMAILDARGEIITANNALHTMLEHEPGALVGHLPSATKREQFQRLVRGEIDQYEEVVELRTASGTHVFAELSVFAERSGDELRQAIAFVQDISELRHALDELAHTNDRLRDQVAARTAELVEARDAALEANRAKSRFLANMSHELRTPLNATIGYAEMLQEELEDVGDPQLTEDAGRIHAAGRHLLGLINEILDISKIEAGHMSVFWEDSDVSRLISEVVATVKPLIDKSGNTLHVEVADDVGSSWTDVTKLRQILFNLMSNASKFSEGGRISLRALREEHDEEAWLRFEVSDTGIGMAPEQLSRIFEPFTQADASTTRRYGGTGLGLAISLRFCQLMGGTLEASSESGAGSTFTARLPLRREVPAEVDADSVAASKDDAPTGPTVLVVDDEPDAREYIGGALREAGYHVVTAASGNEALERAREYRPAVITLDVIMPTMDGWAVLSKLKADPDLFTIPVCIVTVSREQGMGYALGAVEFLSKPIEQYRLVEVVGRHAPLPAERPVLVVEDDLETRNLVARTLRKAGWSVDEAFNGADGLSRAAARKPGVVLLDLMMPEVDGFEFLERFHGQVEMSDVPVVVVTAKELTDTEREYLTRRVAAIVEKGQYSGAALVSKVRELVARAAEPGT